MQLELELELKALKGHWIDGASNSKNTQVHELHVYSNI